MSKINVQEKKYEERIKILKINLQTIEDDLKKCYI